VMLGCLTGPRREHFLFPQKDSTGQVPPLVINAVRIVARRSRGRGNAVPLPWGPLAGAASADVSVAATAYLDRAIVGLAARPGRLRSLARPRAPAESRAPSARPDPHRRFRSATNSEDWPLPPPASPHQ